MSHFETFKWVVSNFFRSSGVALWLNALSITAGGVNTAAWVVFACVLATPILWLWLIFKSEWSLKYRGFLVFNFLVFVISQSFLVPMNEALPIIFASGG